METTTPTPPVERSLVAGGDPDERYPLPTKADLRAGDGVMRAHDLGAIARDLIASDAFPFKELASLKIAYLWSEKGGLAGGFPSFGRMTKESKLHRHFSGFDYVASLSVDHLKTIKATRWQVEALVAHQLGHIACATTEKGEKRYGIKGHDFEGFGWEFAHYGVYLAGHVDGAMSVATAIQMGMVFEESDDEGEDYDPEVEQAPGVASEQGPVAGGAPDPDWAEPNDDTHDPETGLPRRGVDPDDYNGVNNLKREKHLAKIREYYGTRTLDDGSEVCTRCGIRADEHPVDVCAGGVQPPPQAQSKNGNGQHDDALPLIDPDRVTQTLSELGIKIAFEIPAGATVGRYINPTNGEPYSTQWAEGEYRGALGNRRRDKTGAR